MKEDDVETTAAGHGKPGKRVGRRTFIRTSAVGAAAATAVAVTSMGGGIAPAALATRTTNGSSAELVDAGAGFHAEMGTMQMLSAATISSKLVTCAVGQMGLNSDAVAALAPVLGTLVGAGFSGPFAMLMFSENVTSFDIDRSAKTITAKGTMRSITKIGELTIDDAMTPYLAVASDKKAAAGPDTFFLTFKTPFWNTASNPLATPSQFVSGYSQFGGELIMGQVNVAS